MIDYEEARRLVFAEARIQGSEILTLGEAHRRVLAADIFSPRDLPPFDNSAMDGYAIRSVDALKEGGADLRISGEIPAGGFRKIPLNQGEAVKIMTGAAVPPGADAVIPREDVLESPERILTTRTVDAGENVRRQGEDIAKGDLALSKGTVLNAACLGFLAAIGVDRVPVALRPRVGVLLTGNEILDVGEAPKSGAIYDSNSPILRAQIAVSGAEMAYLKKSPDDLDSIVAGLREALTSCRVVVTTGGVSMGDYDLVRQAFEKIGARRVFWKVAQKPGMPLVFDVLEGENGPQFLFGLPGNPGAVMITFEEYVKPFLKLLMGSRDYLPEESEAVLGHEIRKKKGRMNFLRVNLTWKNGSWRAESSGDQGSGILRTLTSINALALLPAEIGVIPEGTRVRIHRLEW